MRSECTIHKIKYQFVSKAASQIFRENLKRGNPSMNRYMFWNDQIRQGITLLTFVDRYYEYGSDLWCRGYRGLKLMQLVLWEMVHFALFLVKIFHKFYPQVWQYSIFFSITVYDVSSVQKLQYLSTMF